MDSYPMKRGKKVPMDDGGANIKRGKYSDVGDGSGSPTRHNGSFDTSHSFTGAHRMSKGVRKFKGHHRNGR